MASTDFAIVPNTRRAWPTKRWEADRLSRCETSNLHCAPDEFTGETVGAGPVDIPFTPPTLGTGQ